MGRGSKVQAGAGWRQGAPGIEQARPFPMGPSALAGADVQTSIAAELGGAGVAGESGAAAIFRGSWVDVVLRVARDVAAALARLLSWARRRPEQAVPALVLGLAHEAPMDALERLVVQMARGGR